MRYIKVQWVHEHPDEPVWLYSELDSDLRETRKVEVFPDGTTGFADPTEAAGGTNLATEPLPDIEEIASDPQFVPSEVDRAEFEEVWAMRRERPRDVRDRDDA